MSNGGKIGFSFNSKKTFNKSVLFQEKSSENAQKAIITPSNKALNKAKKQCIEALEHDKNIFQYDEVYDQISQQKALHSEKKDDNVRF